MTLRTHAKMKAMVGLGAIALGSTIALATGPADAKPRMVGTSKAPDLVQPTSTRSAVVTPVNGVVTVTLVNETGADILYQAIGDTQERVLAGQSKIDLQQLKTPTSLTFHRRDRGFLVAQPRTVRPGVLEVVFTRTPDFTEDRTYLAIEADGDVFLN